LYRFVLAFVCLFAFATQAVAGLNPDAQWQWENGQWNKHVSDDTTYFLRIDEEIGFVYGAMIDCPAGSLEEHDVTIIIFGSSTQDQKVVEIAYRSLCDGSDGKPALIYSIWLEAVGDLPIL